MRNSLPVSIKKPLSALLFLSKTAFLAVLVMSFVSNAAVVKGLYAAKVEVPSRDRAHFERALRKALVVVLAKNSSNTQAEILANPQIAADLENGHKYVEQFSYITEAKDTEDEKLILKAHNLAPTTCSRQTHESPNFYEKKLEYAGCP